jgi:ABC-type Zn uptake system ZnuABC Zn-binding protein ZnuA
MRICQLFFYRGGYDGTFEKIFDEVKNKLSEKKSWATSETAKTMQAQFICLAHNLMLIFEKILKQIGIENVKENHRRRARLIKTLKTKSSSEKRKLPKFLTMPKYATQRPLKFIRWLRNHLFLNTSWIVAVDSLKRVYSVS